MNSKNIVHSIIFNKKEREKNKKINPKKYARLLRKEKWGDFKHLIIFLFITIIIAAFVTAYEMAIPIYKETKEAMFTSLSEMNANTFMRAGNTDIYDVNNKLIGRLGNEKYEYVDISEISPYVTRGYIAKEDRDFSLHMGVDIKGTFRAMLAYVKNRGAITQGGSTITQQVIKNNLLTQERTFKRKITEIFLAWQMEKEYNKAQIMEFYCNSNYYGNGCYGIEGASQYYYGHSSSDLTLAEAAMLVATSNSPNSCNPVVNYDLSMEKKKNVLSDMLECGYITEEELKSAAEEKPKIVKKSENVANENYMITYAIHCAALKLMEHEGFEFKYTFKSTDEYKRYDKKYGDTYNKAVSNIRSGGYSIYTSLNPDIQKILQKSIDKGMSVYKKKNEDGIYELQCAGVCVDNNTGLVAAIVGGREEKGSYNRGYQSKRQPGSSIKPLLDYGPAYNEGIYTPSSKIVDEPVNIDGYKPTNAWSGYAGSITSREGLLRSYNTIAVKTYMKTTKPVALSYLDSLKFTSLTYSDMVAPAVAVGGFTTGATVIDMAKGYATIANKGRYIDNNCLKSMISYDGKEIYKANNASHEVYNEDVAFMLTDILSGMFQEDYMPGKKFKKSSQIYMGKTGTTNDNKDAWFCGSSPYYSTSLWMGYDIPEKMEGIAGGTKPCEIWTSFMDTLHKEMDLEKKEFYMPDTIRLQDSSGNQKEVKYTKDVYKSRPSGYDYVSMILKERREQQLKEEDEKALQKRAEKAVVKFEKFQITTIEEAQSVDSMYNEVYELADSVSDQNIREKLLTRIAYKYELLTGELTDKWANAIEAYKDALQAKMDEENGNAAELSSELAAEAEKNYHIAVVQCYINLLNMQNQYSYAMETWIIKAKEGLETCRDYDEYNKLKSNLDAAIDKTRILQEEKALSETPVDEDNDAQVLPLPTQQPDDIPGENDNGNDMEEEDNDGGISDEYEYIG